jgi:hypothetical protein
MHHRPRRSEGRATADQLARSVGLTLQRLTTAFSVASPRRRTATPLRSDQEVVARARAALTDAREQMPGLMGTSPVLTVEKQDHALQKLAAIPPPMPEVAQSTLAADLRLARMEEMVLRLEDERAQARSEIEALRQIAAELRDALSRLDDRSFAVAGASESDGHLYPAGSVGVELRVTDVRHESEVDQLRAALGARGEVDAVRVTRMRKRKARLRIYLRLPLGRTAYADLLRCAAPLAVPVAGPIPGSISLQLHPS